jgi:hypothetical protein
MFICKPSSVYIILQRVMQPLVIQQLVVQQLAVQQLVVQQLVVQQLVKMMQKHQNYHYR